jgi:uncharacterized protein (DUF1697 family)
MPTYALLLRGVNVGGKKLPMSELRGVLDSLGCTDVATYLQSGNAVVTVDDADPERLVGRAEEGLKARLGLETRILARTGAEMSAVITANPYPETAEATPSRLHVLFLSANPDPADLTELDPSAYHPDEFRLGPQAVYHRYAVGIGRSKLPVALGRHLARAHPGLVATDRNWNTVRRLAEMTNHQQPRRPVSRRRAPASGPRASPPTATRRSTSTGARR